MSTATVTEQRYQYMPPMNADDFEALKRSIRDHGYWGEFAVVVDEDGRILDGHHRARACADLGIECPTRVRAGMSEEEKDDYIWAVNIGRRHLTAEQKRELIRHRLASKPQESDRKIAREVGVSPTTVGVIREELEETVQIGHFPPASGGRGHMERAAIVEMPRCDVCEKPVREPVQNGTLTGHAGCIEPVGETPEPTPARESKPVPLAPTEEQFYRDQTRKLKKLLGQIVKAHDDNDAKALARLIARARVEAL